MSITGGNDLMEDLSDKASMTDPTVAGSPPGMELRSGTKKRRRSRDTTGLTPPDQVEKKRRLTYTSGSQNGDDNNERNDGLHDDYEDSSTEDDQDMDERGVTRGDGDDESKLTAAAAKVPGASNGSSNIGASEVSSTASLPPSTQAAASSSGVTAKRLQPISNLKMPSEQTPGRVVVTESIARGGVRVEPTRKLHFDAPTALQLPPILQQQQAHQQSSATQVLSKTRVMMSSSATGNRNRAGGLPLESAGTRRQGSGKKRTSPQQISRRRVVSQQGGARNGSSGVKSWLSSPYFWFFVLVVLQLFLPIMPIVTQISKFALKRYKSSPPASPKEVAVDSMRNTTLQNTTNASTTHFFNASEQVPLAQPNITTQPNITKPRIVHNISRKKKSRGIKRNRTRRKAVPKKKKVVIIKEKSVPPKPRPKLPPKKVEEIKYLPPEPNLSVEKLSRLTEELDWALVDADMKALSLEIALATTRERVNQRKGELLAWSSALSAAQTTVEHFAISASRLAPQYVDRGQQVLENVQLSSKSSLESNILNTSSLLLWNITIQNCTPINYSQLVDALATSYELETSLEQLRERTTSSISVAMKDSNIIKKVQVWLQGLVSQEMKMNETAIEFLDKLAATHGVGLSLKSVQSGIQDRLEVERADQNGHVDHASIARGAVVVRKGLRATSPSFVDSLPLLNRIMHYSGFRFYGHGPEAALTPTFPPDALGQCWAMENNAKGKCSNPFCGLLGTLTIRFSKPIQATGFIIEHPPRHASDTTSAVRSFRVTGFDDNRALPIGSFTYDIINGRSVQQFTVAQNFPAIHELTLAIDSNWGSPYTCLYRFRVHGESRDA